MRTERFLDDEELRTRAHDEGERDDDATRVSSNVSGDGRRALRTERKRPIRVALASGRTDSDPAALPCGRQRASGTGRADGGAQRLPRRGEHERGPRFDRAIPSGGYQWIYVDGLSDDGAWSIVLIALLGNPFSPAYARARTKGKGVRALDFCSLNVAIYGPGGTLWALHERPVADANRDARSVEIGKSRVHWEGDALVIEIDEETSPFARPLRGKVRFRPTALEGSALSLDEAGLHACGERV